MEVEFGGGVFQVSHVLARVVAHICKVVVPVNLDNNLVMEGSKQIEVPAVIGVYPVLFSLEPCACIDVVGDDDFAAVLLSKGQLVLQPAQDSFSFPTVG